ncbi:YceI family protein [Pikeienuella piscinae]|uniref:YceI family protein n=1 Tax=Pikeienuella piscinae TaxID=2748098 RepID=A0A7L5BVI7_9RHOB|nr:YceI family protein [Pikeienuella piscinae]QIE55401.1 YceI family protein [Pikeienuella piscinae]
MIRPVAALFPLAYVLAGGPGEAEPRAWRIDADASRLAITYLINGAPRRGEIGRFTGWARLDADDPESAEMELEIDMASVDVGDPFGTAIVKTVDWFFVSEYPTGRYVLDRMEPVGEGQYRATGRLTMRGVEHTVVGELTVAFSAGVAEAAGGAEFARSLYGVGVGFTALFVDVGDTVAVEYDLIAHPVK